MEINIEHNFMPNPNTKNETKCPKGGKHIAVIALMKFGEEKCKKCDLLKKNWGTKYDK